MWCYSNLPLPYAAEQDGWWMFIAVRDSCLVYMQFGCQWQPNPFYCHLYLIHRNSSLMLGFLPCINMPTRYIFPAPHTTMMKVM